MYIFTNWAVGIKMRYRKDWGFAAGYLFARLRLWRLSWHRITHEEKAYFLTPMEKNYYGEGCRPVILIFPAWGKVYVLATPLQVLMSAATIANDGKLMQPTLIR